MLKRSLGRGKKRYVQVLGERRLGVTREYLDVLTLLLCFSSSNGRRGLQRRPLGRWVFHNVQCFTCRPLILHRNFSEGARIRWLWGMLCESMIRWESSPHWNQNSCCCTFLFRDRLSKLWVITSCALIHYNDSFEPDIADMFSFVRQILIPKSSGSEQVCLSRIASANFLVESLSLSIFPLFSLGKHLVQGVQGVFHSWIWNSFVFSFLQLSSPSSWNKVKAEKAGQGKFCETKLIHHSFFFPSLTYVWDSKNSLM